MLQPGFDQQFSLAVVWVAVLSVAIVALLVFAARRFDRLVTRQPGRSAARGFEVKPTAGGEQAPALREKDDSHG